MIFSRWFIGGLGLVLPGMLWCQLPGGDTAASVSRQLDLTEVLAMSEGSAEAQIARHTFLASHREYETVRKEILPTLSFSGTLPQISRTFSKTTLPDGRETFVPQFYGDYSGGLQLSQFIPQTNTTITVGTSLERLDIYGSERSKSYLATPFGIGISQSLFTYNASRWERKLNPIKYSAARQRYLQEREAVYSRAVELYFDLLMAQEAYRSAAEDRAYADTLHAMAKEKHAGGKIVESELLEVELNALQAGYEVDGLRPLAGGVDGLEGFPSGGRRGGMGTGNARQEYHAEPVGGKGLGGGASQQCGLPRVPATGDRGGGEPDAGADGEPFQHGDIRFVRAEPERGDAGRFVHGSVGSGDGVGGAEHPDCGLGTSQGADQHGALGEGGGTVADRAGGEGFGTGDSGDGGELREPGAESGDSAAFV